MNNTYCEVANHNAPMPLAHNPQPRTLTLKPANPYATARRKLSYTQYLWLPEPIRSCTNGVVSISGPRTAWKMLQ